MKAIEIIGK